MAYAISILIGYALGCIPFPYLLGRMRGVSLYETGTGNPGAANLFRQVSRPLGVLAALLDMAKGALAVSTGEWLGLPEPMWLLPGVAAVAGQWYPAILKFRGGEGLATAVGVALGALPIAGAVGAVVGVPAVAALRNTGYGVGLGWTAFLGVALARGSPLSVILGLMVLGVIILLRSVARAARARRGMR